MTEFQATTEVRILIIILNPFKNYILRILCDNLMKTYWTEILQLLFYLIK